MILVRFGDDRNLVRKVKVFIEDEAKVASKVNGVE